MLTRFSTHIASGNFFGKDQNLLIAVSGGADSIVLCHLLHKLEFKFSIAHCNFQLRGKESEGDEKFVRQLAKKFKCEIFVKRFDTKKYSKEKKVSVQMAARELRYNWFEELLHSNIHAHANGHTNGPGTELRDVLLTAHHLNDNVETFLLNFIRGTGMKGLRGIPERTEKIVRPLLIFTKEEILNFAKKNKIKFREDSSNYDEKYARNLLRKKVIPILKKLNPSLEKTFLHNLSLINQHAELLSEITSEKKKKFLKKEKDTWILNSEELKKEKHAAWYLFEILSSFGFNTDQSKTAEQLSYSQSGKIIESDKFILVKDRNSFVIREKTIKPFNEIRIEDFPCGIFGEINLKFTVRENKKFVFPTEKNTACFDLEKFSGKTIIRKWKEGDSFQPFGMKGTKKLSDYFISQKMNLFEKQNVFILENGKRIAWILGKRIDERFAVTDKTKKILVAEIIERS